MTAGKNICVVIPTLNEAGTIAQLCLRINEVVRPCSILVIDDNSTDGTLELVRSLMKNYPNIDLVARPTRMGIGSAHKFGIREASQREFEVVVTMDADLTHNPDDLPNLLDGLQDADLVVGSRFVEGGGLDDWSLGRKVLTYVGHIATRLLLHFDFDSSSGFRAYRLNSRILHAIGSTPSNSYAFLPQSIAVANHLGVRISQVPVVLPSRTYGHSKMRLGDLRESIVRLIQIRKLLGRIPYDE
jgi:dolichol-phosphate mannosyltransferase